MVWDHLGDVYFRLDKPEQARAAWQKAVSLYEAERSASRTTSTRKSNRNSNCSNRNSIGEDLVAVGDFCFRRTPRRG